MAFNGSIVESARTTAFRLTIVATDDHRDMLSGQNVSTIIVADVNERPELEEATFFVPENQPTGTLVGDLSDMVFDPVCSRARVQCVPVLA